MREELKKGISNYLEKFNKYSREEYIDLECKRVDKYKPKKIAKLFKQKLTEQELCCYFCNTDIRDVQSLIKNHLIYPRKRGKYGYSGMHFEIEHLNADKTNNAESNIVLACYYCNNDKSNTIEPEIFKKFFGKQKSISFKDLIEEKNIKSEVLYWHYL
jgi:5-methylcytosine-specific restriction endonuclease McrA|tara:strand:+ start:717 stop:1190 length:474 start_codon:yes stop_codon:yes gene_type:complete